MLSNIDVKYSQNKDNNNDRLKSAGNTSDAEDNRQYDDQTVRKNGPKVDTLLAAKTNPLAKHKDQNNGVTVIRNEAVNEVLHSIRHNDNQFHTIATQIKPEVYRIAFDDQLTDDVLDESDLDDNDDDIRADHYHHRRHDDSHKSNTISTDMKIVTNDPMIGTSPNVQYFGKIIDEQNVELLATNGSYGERPINHRHVYVNQLSLADEVAIAECNQQSLDSNTIVVSNDKTANISRVVKHNFNHQTDNGCEKLYNNFTPISDTDSDHWNRNSVALLLDDDDMEDQNPPESNPRSHTSATSGAHRGRGVSLHRFYLNSRNAMLEMPANSVQSIRDYVCCCVQ